MYCGKKVLVTWGSRFTCMEVKVLEFGCLSRESCALAFCLPLERWFWGFRVVEVFKVGFLQALKWLVTDVVGHWGGINEGF